MRIIFEGGEVLDLKNVDRVLVEDTDTNIWIEPTNDKVGHWIEKDGQVSAVCSCCNRNNTLYGDFCKWCEDKSMTKEELKKLNKGDIVYVACKVDAVFIESGLVQVSTRDCTEGFDAYEDEITGMHFTKESFCDRIENTVKDLSERVENIEKQMKEDKEAQLEKLKADLEYAKFCCALKKIDEFLNKDEKIESEETE